MLQRDKRNIQSIALRDLYSRKNTCDWNWNARTALLLQRFPYTWPLLKLIGDFRSGE
jgi:hypothetical protein